jgi:hypothetical protein
MQIKLPLPSHTALAPARLAENLYFPRTPVLWFSFLRAAPKTQPKPATSYLRAQKHHQTSLPLF